VSESYEVLAVRYGTRQASGADVFLSFPVYGEPDRPLGMDYFFWVARSPSRTIVVDSGFSPAGGAARRRTTLMDMATALRAAGRLTLTGRSQQVAPGVELTEVGGHTPGQAIVSVDGGPGRLILASDAVHYYEELERDRPFSTVVNLADMYAAFDQIREMEQDAGTRVIAGHDPVVAERFPAFHGQDGVFLLSGLAKPRNGTER
jgi:glyoxylase-like metal-dependent hydrolase (beta-lactamase superfamily II)